MKQLVMLLVVPFLMVAASARTEVVTCKAKVTNRWYEVSLDLKEQFLRVVTDNGYRYEGKATLSHSPGENEDAYFLPTGYGRGLELAFELKGQQRIAFCLQENECWLCRK